MISVSQTAFGLSDIHLAFRPYYWTLILLVAVKYKAENISQAPLPLWAAM